MDEELPRALQPEAITHRHVVGAIAATVSLGFVAQAQAGELTITGYAPTVLIQAATDAATNAGMSIDALTELALKVLVVDDWLDRNLGYHQIILDLGHEFGRAVAGI